LPHPASPKRGPPKGCTTPRRTSNTSAGASTRSLLKLLYGEAYRRTDSILVQTIGEGQSAHHSAHDFAPTENYLSRSTSWTAQTHVSEVGTLREQGKKGTGVKGIGAEEFSLRVASMGVSPQGPSSTNFFEGAGPGALEDLFHGAPREGEGEVEGGDTGAQRADFSSAGPGPGSSVDMGGAEDVLRDVSDGKPDPGLALALDLGVDEGRGVQAGAKVSLTREGPEGATRADLSGRRVKRSENETAKASERRRRKLQRQEKKMGLPPGALREGTKAKNLSAMLSSKAAGGMRHAGSGMMPGYAGFPHGYHGMGHPDHRAPYVGIPMGGGPGGRSSTGGTAGAGRGGGADQTGLVPLVGVGRKDAVGASALVEGMPVTKGRRGRPRSSDGAHAMTPPAPFPSADHGVTGMGYGMQPDFEQVALAHASQASVNTAQRQSQFQTSKRARSKGGGGAPPAQDPQHLSHGNLYNYPATQQPGQQHMGAMMAAMGYFQGGGPPGPNGAQGHAAVHWPPSTFPPAYASWAYLAE